MLDKTKCPSAAKAEAEEAAMLRRDPKRDPKAGDIIRFGGIYCAEFHEVLEHDPRMGWDDVSSFSNGIETPRSIHQWREFAAGSEVIRRAEDAAR